ncbi:BrnA antitoxin family protein [Selenomonas sp.]|jgi:hypothetical protein|uniref:BrnA antitoxin family protein n=1 Tax=Selenomonas sp. TaxID=2053611 RepID=UPI0025EA8462|nr:BrnA antitoxin family protein [Selenomonas sp.]MCI6086814.1 hypothetical protein [Selenomonas sp.]MDY3297592.1 hypothetical protein [Selenomonas sp.]
MAIHEAIVYEGQKPPQETIDAIRRAAKFPINYDDAPPLTDEQLARGAAIVRARRAAAKKENVTIRIPHETISKAKELLGNGYTSVLRRLIVKAVNHPELLEDCR